jgi:hypothetical protein
MSDEVPDMKNLRWIRIFNPLLIPKKLVEQVRDRDFTVEDFYHFHEASCIRNTEEGPTFNPLSHLYVLANEENLIKGFLWFTVDPLSKNICIQTYSVEKEFWYHGQAVQKVAELVKKLRSDAGLNKIYWVTNYPKHSERYGFKRSDSILMEYSEEKIEEKGETRG